MVALKPYKRLVNVCKCILRESRDMYTKLPCESLSSFHKTCEKLVKMLEKKPILILMLCRLKIAKMQFIVVYIRKFREFRKYIKATKMSLVSGQNRCGDALFSAIFFLCQQGNTCIRGDQFPIYKVWWLREASQIRQTFIPLCE